MSLWVDTQTTTGSTVRPSTWNRSFAVATRLAAGAMAVSFAAQAASAQQMGDSVKAAQIHFKGITITPVGFAAAEAVWREKNETADIGSSFSAIPFEGTTNANLNELRGTARQSRIGVLAEGMGGDTKFAGYWESDFLTNGTTSNSNESNSYALRIRQFWGRATLGDGWQFTAGQMWSLLTTDKSGVAARNEWVPLTIDAQYAAGFNWARQFGVRIAKDLVKDKVWFAASAEESQTTFTAHGANDNFVVGQPGGSLLNATTNYSSDPYPDVIGKLVFEPGFGHYEIKVVGSALRDRVIDVSNIYGGTHNSTTYVGGVGAAALWQAKVVEDGKSRSVVDFGISGLWGNGIGRYGTVGLSDATVRPNGELAPIRSAMGLVSLETHPTRRLDIYGYAGAEYAYRQDFLNGTKGEGYGSPLLSAAGCTTEFAPTGPDTPGAAGGTNPGCNADNRAVAQGNLGFWYSFYQGPAGRFAWGMQYSYTERQTWSGAPAVAGGPGVAPTARDMMVFNSFRYYLP
jgi:hypothetical protein